MELILVRKFFANSYTIGKILHDQNYLCDTLEDKVRDLQDINHDGDFTDPGEGKIYGQTAIPEGRYEIKIAFSPKKKKMMPYLQNVPGFSGIMIHSGNTPEDTEGCILVGENKVKGQVINSKYHEAIIHNMVFEAISLKDEVFITIKS